MAPVGEFSHEIAHQAGCPGSPVARVPGISVVRDKERLNRVDTKVPVPREMPTGVGVTV